MNISAYLYVGVPFYEKFAEVLTVTEIQSFKHEPFFFPHGGKKLTCGILYGQCDSVVTRSAIPVLLVPCGLTGQLVTQSPVHLWYTSHPCNMLNSVHISSMVCEFVS